MCRIYQNRWWKLNICHNKAEKSTQISTASHMTKQLHGLTSIYQRKRRRHATSQSGRSRWGSWTFYSSFSCGQPTRTPASQHTTPHYHLAATSNLHTSPASQHTTPHYHLAATSTPHLHHSTPHLTITLQQPPTSTSNLYYMYCTDYIWLECFAAVGWVAGRASGL